MADTVRRVSVDTYSPKAILYAQMGCMNTPSTHIPSTHIPSTIPDHHVHPATKHIICLVQGNLIFILKVSHNTFKRFNVFTDANERGVLYTAYRGSMTRSSSADASSQANDVQTHFEWFKNGENMVGKIMQATLDAES